MDKSLLLALALLVVVAVAAVAGVVLLNQERPTQTSNSPTVYTYKIIHTYPHDTAAYTEGLIISDGFLYESTGGYGTSTLRQVDLQSGNVTNQIQLPDEFFGEGLAMVGDRLVQLTWKSGVGFVYNKETLASEGNFTYPTEGWGLTYNGSDLIMSDGTSNLYFLDPITFQRVGQVSVHDNGTAVTNINELEYVNGMVYANIWFTQEIAIINPATGTVTGWIDLSGIYPNSGNSVLNGIAYDQQTGNLYVTGKDWPEIYQIQITPKNR